MSKTILWLSITLQSSASLGRGDGVAGLVDDEIKHDRMGLPYLSGKTLKGLLVAQCAEVLDSLYKVVPAQSYAAWEAAAERLFGNPEQPHSEPGKLRFENATLPPDLRARVAEEYHNLAPKDRGPFRADMLAAVTSLRRQTAMDARTGAPLRNTLRTVRVVIRSTPFLARIEASADLDAQEKALLDACTYVLRRLGSHRNRGLGAIHTVLYEYPPFDSQTNLPLPSQPVKWLAALEKEVSL